MSEDAHSELPPVALSIVVTCYNLERYIRRTLESVFAQDYKGPMQLIVVDDASVDSSWQMIRDTVAELGQGWDVSLIRLEQNMGVAGATDAAWRVARYDWIVEVDGDDVQCHDRCSNVVELIGRHPEVGMIVMSSQGMDADDALLDRYDYYSFTAPENVPDELYLVSAENTYSNWCGRGPGPKMACFGATTSYRRPISVKWGEMQTGRRERAGIQDQILGWRYMASAPVCGSRKVACYYRTHAANICNRSVGAGYEGFVNTERFGCRRASRDVLSLRSILLDVDKALATPGLSHWTPEQLKTAREQMASDMAGAELRADWWDIPWHQRVMRAFRSLGKVPPHLRAWPWVRLMPLRFTAWLRWMLKEKLRRR